MHFVQRGNGRQPADPVHHREYRNSNRNDHSIELQLLPIHLKWKNFRLLVVDFLFYTWTLQNIKDPGSHQGKVSKEGSDISLRDSNSRVELAGRKTFKSAKVQSRDNILAIA